MNGGGGPRAFWERKHGFTLGSPPPGGGAIPERPAPSEPFRLSGTSGPARPPEHPFPSSAPPGPFPGTPPPSGPPARVGGAVAALVVSVLTVVGPGLMAYLGFWFFLLAVNVPGICFGIAALRAVPDAERVERHIRGAWACVFAYVALFVLFMIPIVFLAVMMTLFAY